MWVIITRDECDYCSLAKKLLALEGINYTVANLQYTPKYQLSLMKMAGLTTVPQVFKPDGAHVGGYTELKQMFDEGDQWND